MCTEIEMDTEVCIKCGLVYQVNEMFNSVCNACAIGLNDDIFTSKSMCELFIESYPDALPETVLEACTQHHIPVEFICEDRFWSCEYCGEVYESIAIYKLNGHQVKVRRHSSCLCSLMEVV